MFFGAGRIEAMQEMILSDTTKARQKALAKLLPYQREDFKGILTAMKGYPVTIRLLDPPLHEFLPREEDRQKLLAKNLGHHAGDGSGPGGRAGRGQPHAGSPGVQAGHHLPGDPGHAGHGHRRSRHLLSPGGDPGHAGDHDSTGRFREGACRSSGAWWRRRSRR